MNAICGLYRRNLVPVEPGTLLGMLRELDSFGSVSGTHTADEVALGLTSNNPSVCQSGSSLPRFDATTELCITADLRLDNRTELASSLRSSYNNAIQLSDSRLLLLAYRKWGCECLQYLQGDYAFAIWDAKDKRLFCARDILGCKPFFYQLTHQSFAFGTTAQAILSFAVNSNQLDIDPHVVAARLCLGRIPLDRTVNADVRRLPPAHAMIIEPDRVSIWKHWHPENAPLVRFDNEQDYIERLLELLNSSIDARQCSSPPVGAHLSGGLDSSAIAVLALRQRRTVGKSLTTFTWTSDTTEPTEITGDERHLVRSMIEHENFDCRLASLTRMSVAEWASHQLQPLNKPATGFVHEQVIRKLAHESGTRVLLSGWGGDELITFKGTGALSEHFLAGHWALLFQELKHSESGWRRSASSVIAPILRNSFARSLLPQSQLPILAARLQILDLFRSEYAEIFRAADAELAMTVPHALSVREAQLEKLQRGYVTERIESWATEQPDLQIEYRYPLLDQRIIEFGLGLPPEMFLHHGKNRYLFRQAMTGILPPNVQWHNSKQEPFRMSEQTAMTWSLHRQVIVPLIQEVLAINLELHYLDPKRLGIAIKKTPANLLELNAIGLLPALRLELMVNSRLNKLVRERLTEQLNY